MTKLSSFFLSNNPLFPISHFVIFTCITHIVIYVKIWIILVNDNFTMLVTLIVLKISFSNLVVTMVDIELYEIPSNQFFCAFLIMTLTLGTRQGHLRADFK